MAAGRFPPDFLDRLRERAPIVEIVGRKVALKQRGRGDWWGLSPFVTEKTPSFHVLEDRGFYKCFSTQKSGDVIGFVIETEGLSFMEAVERLAAEAGLPVPQPDPDAAARAERRATAQEALTHARDWFADQLRGPAGQAARAYLQKRGLSEMDWAEFGLGYAPDSRDALKIALAERGAQAETLVEAGLTKAPEGGGAPFSFFRNRIMFPVEDRQGRVIGFGARALGDVQPKYLNSPETPLFKKGEALYGWPRAREACRKGAALIVAEGYMDVIALVRAGFPGAVAPLGTAITESQIEALWRMADAPILCLDGDRAGRAAALRAADRAWPRLKPGKTLKICLLPDGEDPDTLTAGGGGDAIARALEGAASLSDFIWRSESEGRDLKTPEMRAEFAAAIDRRTAGLDNREIAAAYAADFDRRWVEAFGAPRTGGAPPTARRARTDDYERGYREGLRADPDARRFDPDWTPAWRAGYAQGVDDARAGKRFARERPGAIGRFSFSRKQTQTNAIKASIRAFAEIEALMFAIRHPDVVAAELERFGEIPFSEPAARTARDLMVAALTDRPEMTSDELRDHVAAAGHPMADQFAAATVNAEDAPETAWRACLDGLIAAAGEAENGFH